MGAFVYRGGDKLALRTKKLETMFVGVHVRGCGVQMEKILVIGDAEICCVFVYLELSVNGYCLEIGYGCSGFSFTLDDRISLF